MRTTKGCQLVESLPLSCTSCLRDVRFPCISPNSTAWTARLLVRFRLEEISGHGPNTLVVTPGGIPQSRADFIRSMHQRCEPSMQTHEIDHRGDDCGAELYGD